MAGSGCNALSRWKWRAGQQRPQRCSRDHGAGTFLIPVVCPACAEGLQVFSHDPPQAWWEVTSTLRVFLQEPAAPRPPPLVAAPGSLSGSLPSYLSSWAPWSRSRASAPWPSPASLPPDDSCDGSGSVSPCEIVTSPQGRPVLPGVRPRPPPQLRLPSCSYTRGPLPTHGTEHTGAPTRRSAVPAAVPALSRGTVCPVRTALPRHESAPPCGAIPTKVAVFSPLIKDISFPFFPTPSPHLSAPLPGNQGLHSLCPQALRLVSPEPTAQSCCGPAQIAKPSYQK